MAALSQEADNDVTDELKLGPIKFTHGGIVSFLCFLESVGNGSSCMLFLFLLGE